MLYGEIDRLSAAWATLDEQNSSKVFNLVNLEEKVQRLNTEVSHSSPPILFSVEILIDVECRKRKLIIDTLQQCETRIQSLLRMSFSLSWRRSNKKLFKMLLI